MIIYGSGNLINFPFGFSVGNFHFQKGYRGDAKILMGINEIFNVTKKGKKNENTINYNF